MSIDIPELEYGFERLDLVRWLREVIALIGPGFHFETAADEYVNAEGERIFTIDAAKRFDADLKHAAARLGRTYFEARCLREVWRAGGYRYSVCEQRLIAVPVS